MKLATFLGLVNGSLLLGMSTTVLANEHNEEGLQAAINQHNTNIQRFETRHAGKTLPQGLTHSREILEGRMAGNKPDRPEVTRPDRPEMPDIAMRPELPDVTMSHSRPEPPNRPDRPNNGRH